MKRLEIDTSLRGEDPGRWGHSMANVGELLLPVLDARGTKSVAEVGAYAGDLTRVLLDWAADTGASVSAVDPLPQPALVELAASNPALRLIEKTSAEAFREMELPDSIVLDGDHNYHTVSEELNAISSRTDGPEMPLLIFHDVCWPHGRRDSYYAPERVPEEYQARIGEGVGVFPGEPGNTPAGLPYKWAAVREGGERNGVLTAIEDWIEGREQLRFAVAPMFFGIGFCWNREAEWADAVAALVDFWDRNPIVARLEGNRVFHLASHHRSQGEAHGLRQQAHGLALRVAELEERSRRQQEVLEDLAASKGMRLMDRLARLRHPQRPAPWHERIEGALGGPEGRT